MRFYLDRVVERHLQMRKRLHERLFGPRIVVVITGWSYERGAQRQGSTVGFGKLITPTRACALLGWVEWVNRS